MERTCEVRPTNGDVAVKAVETKEELRLANDLMAKTHGTYHTSMDWLCNSGASYPGYALEHTRVALRNGEVAGALRLTTETIRIGESRLKMGGFGWVSTAPRHRNAGVCRRLMVDSLAYMRRHAYHVSMLFGIPNFYHRFGFATTLADYAIVVPVAEAATAGNPFRVRSAKPGDIAAIQRVHSAGESQVACSLLRSAAHITNKWNQYQAVRVLTDDQGKVVAYFAPNRQDDLLAVEEVGVSAPDMCPAVLAASAAVATEKCLGRIRFRVPPGHPFARALLAFQSCHEMRIVRDRGGMMAFVNLAETLELMIPEWESLLEGSCARDSRCEFTLYVGGRYYRVRANRGAIDVAATTGKNRLSLSDAELMHMVTGYGYAEDILSARRRVLTNEARDLVLALFPKRNPYVWPFDRF